MEEHQNVRLSAGSSELNRSYYTGNSLSALHSSQQFHNDTVSTSVHPLASTQQINDTTPSCSAFDPQLLHGHIGSPVLAGPTRNVTGEAMPTSLAEALTQLSFLEFVQRCNLLIAPSQPTQLPASVSLLDVAVQTASPCEISQDASTQTSDQPVSSLSLDVAVQTIFHSDRSSSLDAAVQTTPHSTLSQHVSTQMGSRSASSFSVDTSVQTPFRCVVQHDAATQLELTEFFTGCIYSNSPLDRQNPVRQSPPSMQGSHALAQPPPGLEQPAPSPELAAYSHLLTTHGASANSSPSLAQQPPVCTTHVGTHPVPTALSAKRSASTALAGTHNPIGSNLRTDAGPFPNQGQWFFPWSVLDNPSPTDLVPLPQLTAKSRTINSAFSFFSGIQARRAEILPTSSLPPVVGFMQLSFRKPATMSRASLITSEHTPTTWTLLSCSTRTPLSQTPQSSRSRPTPRAKIRGAWYYSSFAPCCVARLFPAHLQSHFARYISTMWWPRNVMLPLSFSSSFMPKCWSTMSTS